MPHTRSARKNLRKSEKRRLRNRATKRTIKEQLKKVETAAGEGTMEQLRTEYNLAAKKLDKAAAKRVIHPNTAARKKSQLAKMLHKKEQAAKGPAAAGAGR
jgi:small subunit ribosomal protein S20